jgi:YVTN family beta-propeller protein
MRVERRASQQHARTTAAGAGRAATAVIRRQARQPRALAVVAEVTGLAACGRRFWRDGRDVAGEGASRRWRGVALGAALLLLLAWLVAPGAARAATSHTAYVANSGPGSVTPINTATNTAGTAIAVGSAPVAVAITPDGKTAYVANLNSDSVTPIATATNTAGTAITVGSGPQSIAITPDGKTAYVANSGSGSVTPIDTASNTAGTAITVGDNPQSIAITPDGKTAYVANSGSGSVTPIATATNTAGTAITVGTGPQSIAITPDGKTAYVANSGSDSVTPIATASNTAGTAITVGSGPFAIAITPDGKTAYVANSGSDSVTPIDTASNTARTAITVRSTPNAIAITPDGKTAYVTNGGSSSVTPINTATNTAGTAITVGAFPAGIAITPDQPPVAAFSATPEPAGQASSFDASASADPDGTVASYHWDFGDGQTATMTSATITHTYASAATYTVTVTETDDAGCSTTQVFTGQTVGCNGSSVAQVAHQVTVPAPADNTAPTTSITLSPSSPNGSGGWYTEPVGVTVSASDPDDTSSTITTRCEILAASATPPASFSDLPSSCSVTGISTDGEWVIYAASEDAAGNVESTVQSASVNLDQTPPSLAPTLSTATIYLNQSGVTASANATDATSGVASSSCGTVDTSTAGDHTVTCTATDNAGNTNSATIHYTVQYKIGAFLSPTPRSRWKAGQTVPIKITLTDVNGALISNTEAAGLASACRVTFSASGAQSKTAQCMKYDSTNHQFIYNWMLAKSPTGADTITVTVTYPNTTTTTTNSESITITS